MNVDQELAHIFEELRKLVEAYNKPRTPRAAKKSMDKRVVLLRAAARDLGASRDDIHRAEWGETSAEMDERIRLLVESENLRSPAALMEGHEPGGGWANYETSNIVLWALHHEPIATAITHAIEAGHHYTPDTARATIEAIMPDGTPDMADRGISGEAGYEAADWSQIADDWNDWNS